MSKKERVSVWEEVRRLMAPEAVIVAAKVRIPNENDGEELILKATHSYEELADFRKKLQSVLQPEDPTVWSESYNAPDPRVFGTVYLSDGTWLECYGQYYYEEDFYAQGDWTKNGFEIPEDLL